jgi:PPOX class probable F420-dependent enzyme
MSAIPEQYIDLLESEALAHVATIGPKGEPQSNPVWFGWDGTSILFSQTKDRQKYRNVQRNPQVALSIVDPANPYRYLEVRGKVIRIDEDTDHTFINAMAKKYLAWTPLHRSPQGKNRPAGRRQNRSLPRMPSLRNQLRHPQNKWIRLDLGSRTRSSPPNQPNARFPGRLPLTSSVFWKVVLGSWNVPAVHARAPSNRVVGSCGSSLTTNAKRILPILDNDGPRGKWTGTWLADSAIVARVRCKLGNEVGDFCTFCFG